MVYWPVSDALHLRGHGLGVAIAIGVLTTAIAWLVGATSDIFVTPSRQRGAEKALRFAIDEKMAKAKDERAAAPAPK